MAPDPRDPRRPGDDGSPLPQLPADPHAQRNADQAPKDERQHWNLPLPTESERSFLLKVLAAIFAIQFSLNALILLACFFGPMLYGLSSVPPESRCPNFAVRLQETFALALSTILALLAGRGPVR